jgi:hypothetical protein
MTSRDHVIARISRENPVLRPVPQGPLERAEAERVLHRVLSSTARPPRLGGRMLGGALVALGAACTGGIVAVAIVAAGHPAPEIASRPASPTSQPGHAAGKLPPTNTGRVPQSMPAGLERSFALFARPRTAADALPISRTLADTERQFGLNPRLSRFVTSTPAFRGAAAQTIWVVPGMGYVCEVFKQSGAATACSRTSFAETHGIVGSIVGRNGDAWFGVLPQGARDVRVVRADGSSVSVPLRPDGVFVQSSGQATGLSYLERNGTTVDIPAAAAVPRPNARTTTTPVGSVAVHRAMPSRSALPPAGARTITAPASSITTSTGP